MESRDGHKAEDGDSGAGPGTALAPAGLVAEEVSVYFGGLGALRDVTLSLREGEILGLIGPNGAGKTTLINVLSGLQDPTSGSVRVDGIDVTKTPAHKRAKSGIARTFQGLRLFGNLSVYENAEAAALTARRASEEIRARTVDALAEFGLTSLSERTAAALNHVEQRHLSLARALAGRPRFLLLDEPAAGLSEDESDELLHVLMRVRGNLQCGLLVVEHDMHLIMRLCDRIHVLNEGRTIAVGPPKRVQEDERVIAAYLGSGA